MEYMLSMLVTIIPVLIFISAYDFCYKKIPNYLIVIIVSLGFINNYLLSGIPGLATSFYGLAAGLSASLFFYRFTSFGAGDVKLISAIGCFVGYPLILLVIAYSYIASAVFGILYVKFWLPWHQYRTSLSTTSKPQAWLKQRIPMAPGISLATFYVLYSNSF